jgi:hypothetical protein
MVVQASRTFSYETAAFRHWYSVLLSDLSSMTLSPGWNVTFSMPKFG